MLAVIVSTAYRYESVISLLGSRGRVGVLLFTLLLGVGGFLRPLLQAPLVETHSLPALYLQLLGVSLLVSVLAVDMVSPAALYPLP